MREITVAYRAARESDMPGILDVLRTVNMHHIPSAEMPDFDLELCLVAEIDGKIVGLSGYKILSADVGKTTLLAVNPEHRSLGLGHKLQTWRMNELLKRDIRYLITNADRPETIAWYEKHFGYRKIGRLEKEHEFGRPDIDHWTTLKTDLFAWKEQQEKRAADAL